MKKAKRIVARTILVLVCLILLIAAFSIRPVDNTPYFQSQYFHRTIDRLSTIEGQLEPPEISTLKVGYGVTHITPPVGTPLAGYSARKSRPSTGVHDSLFAKAVAFKSDTNEVILIGIDGLIVSRNMAERVMQIITPEIGLKRHRILFNASHAHSAAGAWENSYLGEIFAGNYDQAIFDFLTSQMAKAIFKARASLKAAVGTFNSIDLPQFTRNRLIKEYGTIDPEFSYGYFKREDSSHIILGSYSAHPTTLPSTNMEFSGDYPGYWERWLERRCSGMAVFFAGGVGSHRPEGKGRAFERAQYVGEAIAESLYCSLSNMQLNAKFPILSFGLVIDLPEPHVRISDGWRLTPWISDYLIKEHDSYLQLVAIGKTLMIGTPCDFSGELAAQLKDFAFRKGYRLIVCSFNGSYLGYIIPSKYYHYVEYESRLMSFYGPTMGDYIPDLMRRMIEIAIRNIDKAYDASSS